MDETVTNFDMRGGGSHLWEGASRRFPRPDNHKRNETGKEKGRGGRNMQFSAYRGFSFVEGLGEVRSGVTDVMPLHLGGRSLLHLPPSQGG